MTCHTYSKATEFLTRVIFIFLDFCLYRLPQVRRCLFAMLTSRAALLLPKPAYQAKATSKLPIVLPACKPTTLRQARERLPSFLNPSRWRSPDRAAFDAFDRNTLMARTLSDWSARTNRALAYRWIGSTRTPVPAGVKQPPRACSKMQLWVNYLHVWPSL